MIRGNTSDLIAHPLHKESTSTHGASHQAWAPIPQHLNPALNLPLSCLLKAYKIWLLTVTVDVVPLKIMEKWRNNKPPILQMAIERNYYITMHHQAGVNFENFTEVKFQDILLTGTDV